MLFRDDYNRNKTRKSSNISGKITHNDLRLNYRDNITTEMNHQNHYFTEIA